MRSLGWAEQEEQQFDRTLGLDEIFAYPGQGCTVVPRGRSPAFSVALFPPSLPWLLYLPHQDPLDPSNWQG